MEDPVTKIIMLVGACVVLILVLASSVCEQDEDFQ